MTDISTLHNHYIELVSILARGGTISDIEKFGSKILGNPMMITDETFFVLAYSQYRTVSDPIWKEIIRNKYSPTDIVNQTNINEFWKRLENSSVPLFVEKEAFKGCTKRVVARIKIGAKTKGYIALLEIEKEIQDEDLMILQMLAEVLGVKINEANAISTAVGQMKDEFAKEILTGSVKNKNMIISRAKTMQLSFFKWNVVVSVKTENNQKYIGKYLEDIRSLFNRYGDLCIYTFDGMIAFYIISFKKLECWNKIMGSTVESYMKKNGYICTVSLPTDSLLEISRCFEQVKQINHTLALVKKKLKRKVYSYNYSVPYNMIMQLYESENKALYECRALKTLLQIDKNEKTDYVNTIRCYFKNNQNVTETAKELYIHRNTVNYRLNKIRMQLEDDFDNYLIRLHLQIAIMAHDLLHDN